MLPMLRLASALLLALPALAQSTGFVSVREGRFIDAEGRQLMPRGLSVISKNKADGYLSWHGPEDFAKMRRWGMNCIRLGILWDGLEPQPGVFDEQYLKGVDQRVAWAKAAGLLVVLDMHQDLYAQQYSDGAPAWATLTDELPHQGGGGVWSDAYLTSPAIQRAFDNFWANKPCADGIGVQDHFAAAWKHVAARYAHEPAVLGYDLFNEPNIGSGNLEAQQAMSVALAQALTARGTLTSPEALAAQWLDVEGRHTLMESLGDIELYRTLVDAAGPVFSAFERDQLTPMFQRVRDAIREVDARHIIFLETSMSANMGVPCGLGLVKGSDGKPDPLLAFAPHGYDIVVDTPDNVRANPERVELIFSRHGETARRLGLPMWVGEWGAYGGAGPEILPAAQCVVRQFEKLACGDIYWDYGRDIDKTGYFPVLCRPYPERVAGTLMAYESNPETGAFSCRWNESAALQAPTLIYVPGSWLAKGPVIAVEPPVSGTALNTIPGTDGDTWVSIPPAGTGVERRFSLSPAAKP